MGYEEQTFPRSPCYKRILNSAAAADLVAHLGQTPLLSPSWLASLLQLSMGLFLPPNKLSLEVSFDAS